MDAMMVQVRIFVRRKGMAGFRGGYWANVSVGLHQFLAVNMTLNRLFPPKSFLFQFLENSKVHMSPHIHKLL